MEPSWYDGGPQKGANAAARDRIDQQESRRGWNGAIRTFFLVALVIATAGAVAGCSPAGGLPYPGMSFPTKLNYKLLSKVERDKLIAELASAQAEQKAGAREINPGGGAHQ